MITSLRTACRERFEAARSRRTAGGFTLLEVIVSLLVLGIIMVPLTAAFISSLKRTDSVNTSVGATDDAQRIASWWTRDVHNVDANGYAPVNGSCPSPGGATSTVVEQNLVTFTWDTAETAIDPDKGRVVPKKASWVVVGQGKDAQLVRRYCEDDAPAVPAPGSGAAQPQAAEMFIAGTFWKQGYLAERLIHGPGGYGVYDFCTTTDCTIEVSGNFDYSLTVDRRIEGVDPPEATTPPCPTITGALGGNGTLTVAWLPSVVPSGMPPVDNYKIIASTQPGGSVVASATTDGSTLNAVLSGLTNGQDYYLQAQAHNQNGWGLLCDPFGPAQPTPVAPGPPLNVVATRGDGQVSVTWDSPTDNGGAGISSWFARVRAADTGELQVAPVEIGGGGNRTAVVTGLTNGVDVVATVSAVNTAGEGPESAPSASVKPCGVPLAPLAPQIATELDQKIRVVYQEPDNNGCTITKFRLWPTPTWTGATPSPWETRTYDPNNPNDTLPLEYLTPSLAGSTAYTMQVQAWNEIGWGALSPSSASTITGQAPLVAPEPATWEPRWYPPAPPGFVDRYGGLLGWQNIPNIPQFNGGYSITGYRVTRTPVGGGTTETFNVNGANSASFDMDGFTQTTGTFPNESYKHYTLTVAAVNDKGAGPAATIDVVPGGRPLQSPTVTGTTPWWAGATANSSAIKVDWSTLAQTPDVNGGRTLTDWRLMWKKTTDSTWQVFDVGSFNTLGQAFAADPGVQYDIRVAAKNASGISIPTTTTTVYAPSLIATPASSAVTMARPAGSTGNRLTLTFPAFSTNPGNPPVSYSARCFASGEADVNFTNLTVGTNTLTNAGLTNGKAWSCAVTGTMTYGNGTTSTGTVTSTNSATPAAPPGAPASVTTSLVSGGKIKVDWTAPTNNGGSAVVAYTVSVSPAIAGFPVNTGAATFTYTTPSAVAYGSTYTFSVTATNVAGAGPATSASPITVTNTPPTVAPSNFTYEPVYQNQIKLTWTPVADSPPSNGGSTITGQTLTLSPAPTSGSATVTLAPGVSTYTYTTNQYVSGNLQQYSASIYATNANGNGPTASLNGYAGGTPTAAVTNTGFLPYNANNTIDLTWTPVPNSLPTNGGKSIDGYNISWSYGGGPYTSPYFVGGQQSHAAIGGVTAGVAYTFRVWANNAGGAVSGNGPVAQFVAVIPGPPTVVGTPSLIRPPESNVFATLYLTFPAWSVTAGSPAITDYTANCTSSDGGIAKSFSGLTPGVQNNLTGLSFQKTYTCSLTATNTFPNSPNGTTTLNGIGPAVTR